MILILFQKNSNSNSLLVKKYCVDNKVPHYVIDVDLFGLSTHHTCRINKEFEVIIDNISSFTGIFNGVFDLVGKDVINEIPDKYKKFIENELFGTLIGSLVSDPEILWLNHPDAIFSSSFKLKQLHLAKSVGFEIPKTIVSSDSDELREFWSQNQEYGVIIKSVFVGHLATVGNQHELLFTNRVTRQHIDQLPSYCSPPVLLQTLVQKKRELRVVVVGPEVFCCTIGSDVAIVDWRTEDRPTQFSEVIDLSNEIKTMCVSIMNKLKLKMGVLDLIEDIHGDYYFLEVNQQGGWGWLETKLGLPISKVIVNSLTK